MDSSLFDEEGQNSQQKLEHDLGKFQTSDWNQELSKINSEVYEIYSKAMLDMRKFVEGEVKSMRKLSDFGKDDFVDGLLLVDPQSDNDDEFEIPLDELATSDPSLSLFDETSSELSASVLSEESSDEKFEPQHAISVAFMRTHTELTLTTDFSIQSCRSLLGLNNSCSEQSTTGPALAADQVQQALQSLTEQVQAIHKRVLTLLRQKYHSILTSDDNTRGLNSEVISRLAVIKPLFTQLQQTAQLSDQSGNCPDLADALTGFCRTLTTVEKLLQIHEALATLSQAISSTKYVVAVWQLDLANAHIKAVDIRAGIESDRECEVFRLMKTEVSVQREQLMYRLSEEWLCLLEWNICPDSSEVPSGQPGRGHVQLRIKTSSENKVKLEQVSQAMHEVGLLNSRLKSLSDKLLTYIVEPLVRVPDVFFHISTDENQEYYSLVKQPLLTTVKPFKEVVPEPCAVSPSEAVSRLHKLVEFLGKILGDLNVYTSQNDNVDQNSSSSSSSHSREMMTRPGQIGRTICLIGRLGEQLCRRMFADLYGQSLVHSLSLSKQNWPAYNEIISLAENFMSHVFSVHLLPKSSDITLFHHFRKPCSAFASLQSQELLKQSHKLLLQPLNETDQISNSSPVGDLSRASQLVFENGLFDDYPIDSSDLTTFVLQCCEGKSLIMPTCRISCTTQSLVSLAYQTAMRAVRGSVECAALLSQAVLSMFELFIAIIPSHHQSSLVDDSLIAAIQHNSCMFIAHHLLYLDQQFKKKVGQAPHLERAKLTKLIPKIRKMANNNFSYHIIKWKKILCKCIAESKGFDCVADDNGKTASESVHQMLDHLQQLSKIWQKILPQKVYLKALGTLIEVCLSEIISSILSIEEFSSGDCDCLHSIMCDVLDAAATYFKLESDSATAPQPEVRLQARVPSWLRFTELTLIVNSTLREVADRWSNGKGPLALHFSRAEVKLLVVAMYEDTSKRDKLLFTITH